MHSLPDTIGLIAGKGTLPKTIAQKVQALHKRLYVVGFKGITDSSLKIYAEDMTVVPLGQVQSIIAYFKANNVRQVIAVGLVKHNKLFTVRSFDARAEAMLKRMQDTRADSILGMFAQELEKEGIRLISAAEVIPEHMISKGVMTRRAPDTRQLEDIAFGVRIAKGTAGLDIGQTIAVKSKSVIAVEAMEGTDRCIVRAGSIAGKDVVIVKVAKPNQDLRFDLPVIGLRTIAMMKKVKASVLAVEEGSTIIVDKDAVIKKADRHNIVIYGHTGTV